MCGLTLVTFALTGSVALALSGALLVVLNAFFIQGTDYPILFMSSHSFGELATSMAVLCIGFLGNRRYFPAGVVAGMLPAFHPVVGCWTIGIVIFGSFLIPSPFKGDTVKLLRGLAVGLIVSAASFAFFWIHRTPVNMAMDQVALSAYLENWEHHRQVGYSIKTLAVTLATLIMLWLLFDSGRRFNKPLVVQTTVVLLISAAASWLVYEFVHRFHASLPWVVFSAMLGRLVNIHFLLAFPIMIGALSLRRDTTFLLLGATIGLAFENTLITRVFLICSLLAGLAYVAQSYILKRIRLNTRFTALSYSIGRRFKVGFVVIAVTAGGASLFSLMATPAPLCSEKIIDNCRAPGVFKKIKDIDFTGLTVAPPGLALMAHRHGHKPVVLGASGIDFVPYLPQTAGGVRDIVESIYGLDFLNPPAEFREKGYLLPETGREYWSKLSSIDWHALAAKFRIGAVIAPSDWEIKLTPAYDMDGLKVYLLNNDTCGKCRNPA